MNGCGRSSYLLRCHRHFGSSSTGVRRGSVKLPRRLHVAAGYTREEKHARLHERIKICEQWQQIRFLITASRRITTQKHGLDMLVQLSCIQLHNNTNLVQGRESRHVVKEAFELAVGQGMEEYQANDFADLIITMSILQIPRPALLRSAVASSIAKLATTSTQHFTSSLWALAHIGFKLNPTQLAVYLRELNIRLDSCTPRQLTAISTALVALGAQPGGSLLRKFDAIIVTRFDTFTIQQQLYVFNSLQQLGHDPSEQLLRSFSTVVTAGGCRLMTVQQAVAAIQCITSCGALQAARREVAHAASALVQNNLLLNIGSCSLQQLVSILSSIAKYARGECSPAVARAKGRERHVEAQHDDQQAAGIGSRQPLRGSSRWMQLALPKVMAACRLKLGADIEVHLLLQLVEAVTTMKLPLSSAWWDVFLSAALSVIHMFDLPPLLRLLDCVLQSGAVPSVYWTDQYWLAVDSRLDGQNVVGAAAVLKLQRTWGLQLPGDLQDRLVSIMTRHLQQQADQEQSQLELHQV